MVHVGFQRTCLFTQLEVENHELKTKLQRLSKRNTASSERKEREAPARPEAGARNSRATAKPESEQESKRVQELEAANAALKEQARYYVTCS